MAALQNYAILIDGAFAIRRLKSVNRRFPTVADIEGECERLKNHEQLRALSLLRIYFYDAAPSAKVLKNPIDGSILNLGQTPVHAQCMSLHQALELRPHFALRMGEAAVHGWTFGNTALRSLQANPPPPPVAADLVPNIEQKGVDLRIGLDIARLALRALVDIIVVVTGDSDLVPAFKFARREGVRIYLDHMGHGVMRDLKVHADVVL
jgi:uncharacterized LabA/DUF88 family protein